MLITINSRNVCSIAHNWLPHTRISSIATRQLSTLRRGGTHIVEMASTSSSEPYRNECDHDSLLHGRPLGKPHAASPRSRRSRVASRDLTMRVRQWCNTEVATPGPPLARSGADRVAGGRRTGARFCVLVPASLVIQEEDFCHWPPFHSSRRFGAPIVKNCAGDFELNPITLVSSTFSEHHQARHGAGDFLAQSGGALHLPS